MSRQPGQTGAPVNWLNGSSTAPGDYIYFGAPPGLDNRQIDGMALSKAAFDLASADTLQYHIRTFPATFGNLRADGINFRTAGYGSGATIQCGFGSPRRKRQLATLCPNGSNKCFSFNTAIG